MPPRYWRERYIFFLIFFSIFRNEARISYELITIVDDDFLAVYSISEVELPLFYSDRRLNRQLRRIFGLPLFPARFFHYWYPSCYFASPMLMKMLYSLVRIKKSCGSVDIITEICYIVVFP
jgi:hypothetical protein